MTTPSDRMAATFLVSLLVMLTPMMLDCAGLFRLRSRTVWILVVTVLINLCLYILLTATCLKWDVTATVCTAWS